MDPSPLSRHGIELERALEEIDVAIYVIGRDGRFEWINRAGVELTGDRRGESYVVATAAEDRDRARTLFARKIVGGRSTAYDLTILDAAGERRRARIASVPLRERGRIAAVLAVVTPQPGGAGRRDVRLTPRKLEVLRLLADGLQTREIARRLGITEETARNHIRTLLRQLGAHSRLEAVVIAQRLGLVELRRD